MFDLRWIGWAGTVFLGMTLINATLGGVFVSSTDVAILNQVGLTQGVNIGFMTLPVPNVHILDGIMHLFKFDYSFFGGQGQLILFGLYSITLMIVVGLFFTIIGIGTNAIRSR